MKGKWYVFSGYNERHTMGLVYLQSKVQEDRYGWCIFKLKGQKTEEKTYLETSIPEPM